jgi:hypothetical protein
MKTIQCKLKFVNKISEFKELARRVPTLPAGKIAGKVDIACFWSVTVKGTLRQALDRKRPV